jgi:hypothetical protein
MAEAGICTALFEIFAIALNSLFRFNGRKGNKNAGYFLRKMTIFANSLKE